MLRAAASAARSSGVASIFSGLFLPLPAQTILCPIEETNSMSSMQEDGSSPAPSVYTTPQRSACDRRNAPMVTSASTFIITRCFPRSIAASPNSAPTFGTPVASTMTSIMPLSRISAGSEATAVSPRSIAAPSASTEFASRDKPSLRRAIATARRADSGTMSATAATSIPSIIVVRAMMSVPITPVPISPMRIGVPFSWRRPKSFARPESAMLLATSVRSELPCVAI